MSNVAISALPVALSTSGADVLPIVQGGVTKQLSNTLLFTSPTLVTPALGTVASGNISACTSTGQVLVAPVLGTPASGNLTNCTGLPIASGVANLGSNVATFLSTPTSANLRAVLTDETGSGVAVFATSPTITSPTLVTPALGTPTSGVLTNCTGSPTFTDVKYSALVATTAAAPTIASATTIAPTTSIVFVSGTTAVVNITAPSPISAGGGQITIIPTGIFTTTTAGNIALASTTVVGKALIMTYDATTSKWYPSY
jgi:hypothetical protein